MRKAFVLLALLLAALSSIADQHVVSYGGYRIGDSIVATDQTRIAGLPARVENSNPTRPELTETNLTASTVIGQKLVCWWAYSSASYVPPSQAIVNGSIVITPASTNYNGKTTIATGGYSLTWTYNTVGYSPAYLVVDYDYIKYNLSYNANGGSGAPSGRNNIVYTNKVSIASGNGVSRTGYTFSGWTNDLTTTVWNDGDTVTGSDLGLNSIVDGSNVVLRAKWTANDYTVKFDANGGIGSMPDQSFTYGTGGPLTSNAFVRAGYTFNGWATSSEGSKLYDDGQTVSNLTSENGGEVTLYAKWSLVYYSLTTSMSGTGSGTVTLIPSGGSYTNGTEVVVTATPANGNTFTGWSDGVTDNQRTYTMTSNISVSAVFTIRTYTVTFEDYNGKVLLSLNCNWGDEMPFPEADPSREGYRFMGWTPTPPETVTRTATYSANYEAKKYAVKFHANYGSGTDTFEDQEFSYGTKQNLASVASLRFAKTGYSFAHWRDSDENTYSDGAEVINLATSGEFDLYAVWSPIAYTIAFDGNGAESGSVDSIDAEYDISYDLPKNSFVRSGFDFKGWCIGSASYDVGDSVSNLTTEAGETVTFSAVWSELRYVAFDGNGADDAGAMIDDVMTFDGVETKNLTPNKFEKTGYTFGGWATNETDAAALNAAYTDGADVVSTNLWMEAGKTNVFYAVWQANTYTVVFKRNGGNGDMEPQIFVYDQPQALDKCVFSSNLDFRGWATNQEGSVVFDDQATVSNLTFEAGGVVTLYAVWDNGELSKAMHCNNLFWTQGTPGDAPWAERIGDEEGYNPNDSSPSGSSVCAIVPGDEEQSYVMMPSGASGGGRLSFWYKMSNADQCWLNFSANGTSELPIDPKTEWTQYGPVDIEDIANVYLTFSLSESSYSWVEYKVYIDQMTWVPDGQEPTDEDKPTISGFTKTTDGFALTVDQTNISDSFSYQILATNELVNGDWPVKETLTADELKAGYEIVIEENEPKMFYKVKVISK